MLGRLICGFAGSNVTNRGETPLAFSLPKIAFLDLEGTLLKKTIHLDDGRVAPSVWTVIAEELGSNALAEENETKDRWGRNEYPSYIAWMRDTVRIHEKYGLTEAQFQKAINDVEFMDGLDDLMSFLKENRIVTCIITGAFKELANRVALKYEVAHAIAACQYHFGSNRTLTYAEYFPSDYFGKVDFMKIMMREYQLTPYDAIFIGDGKNDVSLAKSVSVSFAFNAQIELREVSTEIVDQPSGGETLAEIVRLLKNPTKKMSDAIEVPHTPKFKGAPLSITEQRCKQLWKEAMWARHSAYAPYSGFRVGAAILAPGHTPQEDQIFTGANFENAAYGSTICAERSAVAKMISGGQKNIKAIAIVSDSNEPVPPCGACLQVISEFGASADILLCGRDGLIECHTLDTLLPRRFELKGHYR